MPKSQTRKAIEASSATELEAIPNIGVSLARDLRSIGIKRPHELVGRDPLKLYQSLCVKTQARQDPCVLDTFISAVRFMEGAPARPWWYYTAQRKERYDSSTLSVPTKNKRRQSSKI